jgi:hypothetical protein
MLRPLKSFTKPGLVREGLDNKAEVEAKEKIEKEVDKVFRKPIKYIQKKVLLEEYIPKGFIDLNTSKINSKEVLGRLPRAKD